jgi:hypothetical protein
VGLVFLDRKKFPDVVLRHRHHVQHREPCLMGARVRVFSAPRDVIQGGLTVKIFCPSCGQKLSVPTTDLDSRTECPRCHVVRRAADLVPAGKTVPVIIEYDRYPTVIEATPFGRQAAQPTADVVPDTERMAGAAVPSPQPNAPAKEPGVPGAAGRQPGIKTRAVRGIVAGTAAAGQFGSYVLQCAAWVDRMLSGKRPHVVGAVSVFVLAAPLVDPLMGRSGLASAITLGLFVCTLLALALARLDAFRDAEGFKRKLVDRMIDETRMRREGHAVVAVFAMP